MKRMIAMLSVTAGLATVLFAGTFAGASAQAATLSTASLSSAAAPAAATLTVVQSADRTTVIAREAGQQLVLETPARPDGADCVWKGWIPFCGWKFTHAQTEALHAAAVTAETVVCHKILEHVPGVNELCVALVTWLHHHLHLIPGKDQCLFVAVVPGILVEYVKC